MKKLLYLCIIALLQGIVANAQNDQKLAIEQTALDYADGFYSGNAERLERALHPDFNKVLANKRVRFILWGELYLSCQKTTRWK